MDNNTNEQQQQNVVASSHAGVVPMVSPSPSSATLAVDEVEYEEEDPTDELEIMLLHHDFPTVLTLAAQLKSKASGTTAVDNNNTAATVVERMQQALIQSGAASRKVIPRGRYPMVDAMLKDVLDQLQQVTTPEAQRVSSHSNASLEQQQHSSHKRKPTDPIAVKYAKSQTDSLMQWMIDHKHKPFPQPHDLEMLSAKTGLTTTQVNNWATNVRKRNLKATCEKSKKPHHFIDFLFFLQDRHAKKNETQESWMNNSPRCAQQQQPQYHRPVPVSPSVCGGAFQPFQQQAPGLPPGGARPAQQYQPRQQQQPESCSSIITIFDDVDEEMYGRPWDNGTSPSQPEHEPRANHNSSWTQPLPLKDGSPQPQYVQQAQEPYALGQSSHGGQQAYAQTQQHRAPEAYTVVQHNGQSQYVQKHRAQTGPYAGSSGQHGGESHGRQSQGGQQEPMSFHEPEPFAAHGLARQPPSFVPQPSSPQHGQPHQQSRSPHRQAPQQQHSFHSSSSFRMNGQEQHPIVYDCDAEEPMTVEWDDRGGASSPVFSREAVGSFDSTSSSRLEDQELLDKLCIEMGDLHKQQEMV